MCIRDSSINKTALDTYVQEEYIKFIMGDRPLSEYDAFLAEMANYGDIDLVEEIYNSHIVTEDVYKRQELESRVTGENHAQNSS